MATALGSPPFRRCAAFEFCSRKVLPAGLEGAIRPANSSVRASAEEFWKHSLQGCGFPHWGQGPLVAFLGAGFDPDFRGSGRAVRTRRSASDPALERTASTSDSSLAACLTKAVVMARMVLSYSPSRSCLSLIWFSK